MKEKTTYFIGEHEVKAFTSGEARSLVKKEMGISKKDRLPVGMKITKRIDPKDNLDEN